MADPGGNIEPDGSYYLKGQIKMKNSLPFEGLFIRSYFICLKQIDRMYPEGIDRPVRKTA